jgi:hypothetical protein
MSDRPSPVRSGGIAARFRAALRGRRSSKPTAPTDGLTLQTVPVSVPADLTLLTPTMRVAVVEDACWALAVAGWRERKPFWWRPAARRAWAAEGRTLHAKRDRVRALVEAARDERF